MNNYSKRAKNYKFEFFSKEDFPIIKDLVNHGKDPILEIPCGSGRLIEVHSEHNRLVYMIDLEPLMIERCNEEIINKKLGTRVIAEVGNIKNWSIQPKVGLILIPKGGLQLLRTKEDVQEAIENLSKSLIQNGLIYIDIANPWTSDNSNLKILPEFMRFNSSKVIKGETKFTSKDGSNFYRHFFSIKFKTHVIVYLQFWGKNRRKIRYGGIYRWIRIRDIDITKYLKDSGLSIIEKFGNYEFGEYKKTSPRMIYIAKKV